MQVARANFSLQLANRNATVTDDERLEKRAAFEESLNKVAEALKPRRRAWVAAAAILLRYSSPDDTVAQAIAKAQEAADQLTKSFSSLPPPSPELAAATWAAAAKLVSNHEAVVHDCTEPRSQEEVPRASNPQVADVMIRHVASLLLETAAGWGCLVESGRSLESRRRVTVML